MTRTLAVLLLLCSCSPDNGVPIIRVSDGDSLVLQDGRRVRLIGFDAPETFGRCDYERELARQAKLFLTVALEKPHRLDLSGKLDKYGRSLGTLVVEGTDIAELMIRAGLARPYHGEKRQSWC